MYIAPELPLTERPVLITIIPDRPTALVRVSRVWIAIDPDVVSPLEPAQICTRPPVVPVAVVAPADSTISPPVPDAPKPDVA
jgi:hypothetical protein